MAPKAHSSAAPESHIEMPDLKKLLDDLKEFSPRLARELRRDLRGTGAHIIAAQKAILDGPLPQGLQRNGSVLRTSLSRGRVRVRAVHNYTERASSNSRPTNLREDIKKGLKTRVMTSKTRQGIAIRTGGPKRGTYNMARIWNSRRFRHPVFGDSQDWVVQQGQPYFFEPIREGAEELRKNVGEAIDRALRHLETK